VLGSPAVRLLAVLWCGRLAVVWWMLASTAYRATVRSGVKVVTDVRTQLLVTTSPPRLMASGGDKNFWLEKTTSFGQSQI